MNLEEVGREIGRGCEKRCYALPENRVALIPHWSDRDYALGFLKEEVHRLHLLRSWGIPAFKGEIQQVLRDGVTHYAIVGERWPSHYLSFWSDEFPPTLETYHALKELYNRMIADRIYILDFQFLYDGGRVAVCDPREVERNSSEGDAGTDALYRLKRAIASCERLVQAGNQVNPAVKVA